jgi:methionyl-tRNA formyltransferase
MPSKYRGINIPSWVIINGEKIHGVMWHFAEQAIDSGDVIVFDEFPLDENETAASLMVKCIKRGIDLFPEVADKILKNKISRTPQLKNVPYYGKKDYPKNIGYIDFKQGGAEIDRLVRGLNYLPFKNTFLYAKIKYKGKELIVNSIKLMELKEATAPGKIVLIDGDSFYVECKDAVISVLSAMDESLNEYEGSAIARYLGAAVSDVL